MNAVSTINDPSRRIANLLGGVISDRYLDTGKQTDVKRIIEAAPGSAVVLEDFLLPGRARCYSDAIKTHPNWQRRYHIRSRERLARVLLDEEKWDATPVSHRFSSADHAYFEHGSDHSSQDLRELLNFAVYGPQLSLWMSLLLCQRLEVNDWEVVRFQRGDYIAAHQDRGDKRICGTVLYLDPSVRDASGGRLGFRHRTHEVRWFTPDFNSLAIFPVSDDHWHEVESWRELTAGRHCLTVSFRPAAATTA